MPRRTEPKKVQVNFQNGPVDRRIEEMVLPLPDTLYVPVPPANFSDDIEKVMWRVAEYVLSDATSELFAGTYTYEEML